jgi:L-alanine-DL-glutamate epimerase-like enolase superfamily enzyme
MSGAMHGLMRVEVCESAVEFIERPFIKPLKLSSGTITTITEARTTVRVRVDGREAVGRGTIYLSDLWAWPSPEISHADRDRALCKLSEQIARDLRKHCGGEPHHPLELGLRLHENVCDETVATPLARAMCASPFDAALHDAAGIALECSAFDFYAEDQPLPSADGYFSGGSATHAIRRTIQPPRRELDAWLIVGPDDPLDETFADVIRRYGYRCFKLKIGGKDNARDVQRTVEVYRSAISHGVTTPRLSVDSNEANPDAASVLDYLIRLREADRGAFDALPYLEQPTSRDILRQSFDWREVAALKPVMLDEGLTSLDLLSEAERRHWSGLALKTCKGHSFALIAAAWAREHGLLLSMQDLTNPGVAAIHSALFAARIDTINGVELNSNQFTPAANAEFLPRLSTLFEPRDGVHVLADANPIGLGSTL